MPAVSPPAGGFVGKVKDVTGPGLTDRWGMACTDLGASVRAADGALVSLFGDTFSGNRVGAGEWRSPVILIGTGDAIHEIVYRHAAGGDPCYARQLWRYRHSAGGGLLRRGISTVIPSDLLRVGDDLFLHAIVNRGFGNVVWTEIWRSTDNGLTWRHLGASAKFPAGLHRGHAQCWSWDFDPDDGWVYVVSTGFQRDKGVILRRVRPQHLAERDRYVSWDPTARRWGDAPTPITPPGETWGELSLRRLSPGRWILGGFASSAYALGYRTIAAPTDDLARAPLQRPVVGCGWDDEDHSECRVAQLYGGYVLPGSRLGVVGGVGLMVSQWNTARGWPYRVMQFRVTLEDTTAG
jgi:D-arabinan endo alpha-(1,5)-arabinofuranosidase